MPNAVDDKVHIYWGRGVFNSYLSPQFKTAENHVAIVKCGLRRRLKKRAGFR
jgi:hypothetical protein